MHRNAARGAVKTVLLLGPQYPPQTVPARSLLNENPPIT